MNYWLNVHHPREKISESFQNQCNIYVQEKTENYKDKIKNEDICFIYETARPDHPVKVKESNGSSRVADLRRGARSIIAMVKAKGEFIDHEHWWDDDKYVGLFETEILEVGRIPITTINEEFKNSGIQSRFVPVVFGGIKPVEKSKAKILERLMRKNV